MCWYSYPLFVFELLTCKTFFKNPKDDLSFAVGIVKRAYVVKNNLREIHCTLVKQLIITNKVKG